MPVYRPAASSILRSFRASGKRHLLLTGGRGSGKTTLLRALMPSLCPDAPMLLTAAVPGRWVEMRDTAAGAAAVIGRFDAALPPGENRMRPVPAGFAAVGLPAPAADGGGRRLGRAGRAWLSGERLRGFSTKRAGYVESLPRSRGRPQAGHPVPARALRRPGRLCVRSGLPCAAAGLHRHGLGAGAAVRRQQADGRAERPASGRPCAGAGRRAGVCRAHCRDPLGRGRGPLPCRGLPPCCAMPSHAAAIRCALA